MVKEMSMRYSVQSNPNRPFVITENEIQRFIGILLWMPIIKLPNTRLYWNKDTRIPQVNRFQELKRYLYFNYNQFMQNKVEKIKPVLQQIRSVCSKILMEKSLSCDEQIVPFKSRISNKTYNPKKPHKWGYKLWMLSGVSGFAYDFELFSGKVEVFDDEANIGAASNVVLRLRCKLTAEKEWKKKERGAFVQQVGVYDNVELRTIQWYDDKVVTLLSTFAGSQPLHAVTRYFKSDQTRRQIDYPNIVRVYNKHMGRVDLIDLLIGLYRVYIRSKKWYHRLFFHMIRYIDMPLLAFRKELAQVLTTIGIGNGQMKRRGRQLSNPENLYVLRKLRYHSKHKKMASITGHNIQMIDNAVSSEDVKERAEYFVTNVVSNTDPYSDSDEDDNYSPGPDDLQSSDEENNETLIQDKAVLDDFDDNE
ncbi:hypothetical protein ILUMI_00658 [Ignelater luminosus]|uniref:PiggyBac transposable element-derived protein domain-containing protein n=1 Tax=Ignelater luminosus TaxID=2038154 RepID=A0A8K0GQ05_IGNLU|nr:hypothetical protein ILUMI_00658 [Ignelater luminosus]